MSDFEQPKAQPRPAKEDLRDLRDSINNAEETLKSKMEANIHASLNKNSRAEGARAFEFVQPGTPEFAMYLKDIRDNPDDFKGNADLTADKIKYIVVVTIQGEAALVAMDENAEIIGWAD